MKILTGIDAPFQPFGGSFLCCNDWYSNLPAGTEVRFLTLPPTDGKKWWSLKDVVMLDVEKARTPEAYPDYLAQLRALVEAQIAEYQPDIIHAQHLNYGLSRVFADLETDIPRLGICHGTDVQAAINDPFFLDNMVRICDKMDMLAFPNQYMADDFFDVYGKQKKYVINPLGVPAAFYSNTTRPTSFDGNGKLKVLYAGRLLGWKGADIVVDAIRYVTHPVQLTVIGNEDEKGYGGKMLDQVKQYQLTDSVTFRDQLSREGLMRAFADFDVIVFPSRRLEAFSLTLIEAQAQGLPVAYSNLGGGIVSTAGGSGVEVQTNTPEAWAKVLDALYEQPELLKQAQEKGYKNAEKYRLSRSQERLFDISTELIGSAA